MSTWAWLTDAFLVVLLIGTFVMTMRLDRALRIVRHDRAAFETLITSLSSATSAVKTGIQKLRAEAERSSGHIETRCGEADRMATDLSFLIERAERAGERMESGLLEISGMASRANDDTAPRKTTSRASAKSAAKMAG
jgi:hypothetical protein